MILNDFKNTIIKTINESGLSIDSVYYVMKDIMVEIVDQYNMVLQQEAAAQEEAQKKESTPAAQNEEKEE